jgi:hypothetical protein
LTRSPLAALVLACLDATIGALILWQALEHGVHRNVLAEFFVYAGLVFVFKARDAAKRLPTLVAQARASNTVLQAGPWWLRSTRLVLGYDSWSRTERIGIGATSILVCVLFGWDNGGPFAAALFVAVAAVDGALALVAFAARLSRPR